MRNFFRRNGDWAHHTSFLSSIWWIARLSPARLSTYLPHTCPNASWISLLISHQQWHYLWQNLPKNYNLNITLKHTHKGSYGGNSESPEYQCAHGMMRYCGKLASVYFDLSQYLSWFFLTIDKQLWHTMYNYYEV